MVWPVYPLLGPKRTTAARMVSSPPVLVIDDDDDIRDMVFLVLAEEGYRVQAVENGAVALDPVRRRTFGLILLDMDMPVMNGQASAAAYRFLFAFRARLVVMTAGHVDRSSR
jgi:CheY-like chemotaxis protein